jgi:uncharacterized protein (DUF1800 family)
MAHLMRRAGFGASRAELEELAAQGYDNVVEALLNPESQPNIDEDMMMRYFPSFYQAAAIEVNIQNWVYRMINTPRQLQEKMALFWHMIFCAGHTGGSGAHAQWRGNSATSSKKKRTTSKPR